LTGDSRCSCVFVSAHAAHPLGKLCDHAAESDSFSSFVKHFLSSRPLVEAFTHLYSDEWGVTDEQAWAWLRARMEMRTVDARSLKNWVTERARTYLAGDPHHAVANLQAVCRSSLYVPLDRDQLVEKLATRGTFPRDWSEQDVSLEGQVRGTAS